MPRIAARARLAVLALGLPALLGCVITSPPPTPGAGTPTTTERYRRVAGSADGIGKLYMGREISQVMGWQGSA